MHTMQVPPSLARGREAARPEYEINIMAVASTERPGFAGKWPKRRGGGGGGGGIGDLGACCMRTEDDMLRLNISNKGLGRKDCRCFDPYANGRDKNLTLKEK